MSTLQEEWDAHAEQWIRWARAPGHDSYWRFHRDAFFALLPAPGRLTVDVGCGEGRLGRDLAARGHTVVGVEPSRKLADAARAADANATILDANATKIPLADGAADLVILFMVLQHVDDLDAVLRECARILDQRGRLCIAIVHPINSAGRFASDYADSAFLLRGDYFAHERKVDHFTRDDLSMTFHSIHRPLETYARALEAASLCIEAVREPKALEPNMSERAKRWLRVPLFLHLRARKVPR